MFQDEMSMITESTYDSHMRRTMERLEEKLHRGETTVNLDIRELLHILSRMVSLERDSKRAYDMLYGNFKTSRDLLNLRQTPISEPANPTGDR